MKLIKCRKCGRYFQVIDNDYCLFECTGCGSTDLEETIYKLDGSDIDWEQRRYEIAKSAMQGMLSDANNHATYTTDVARKAVNFANALICELQKKEECCENSD